MRKPARHRSLSPAHLFLLCTSIVLALGSRAAAQQPVVAPAPAGPEFFSRADFHLTGAALTSPQVKSPTGQTVDDPRFSWDTHWGGSLDVVDYVGGRLAVIIDYEAVLGSEFQPFDPYEGNYTLEASGSVRAGSATEIVGIFHHVSRHFSDRPKRTAIAWNVLGARMLHRFSEGRTTLDVDVEGGRTVEHAYVDYTWVAEMGLLGRRQISDRVGAFARLGAQLFAVNGTVPARGTQTGGLVEGGFRFGGKGGALELFAGIEKRVDADPLDRQPQHWGFAGFRLLSR
jgi:hypothetical protein